MAHFSIMTRIFFSGAAHSEVSAYLLGLGIRSLLFIADSNLKNTTVLSGLMAGFEKEGFSVKRAEYLSISSEPSYDFLDEVVSGLRPTEADAIIAVGGGSVLDTAKGVGILLKNPGRGIDYRGIDKVKHPGVPVICYPTTAGTGSEVTHTASFIDKQSQTKLGINSRYASPLCSVLMPELTFTCPPQVTISSGLDAMLHAIEAVSAKTANAVTCMLGAKAFGLLFANFKKVLLSPTDYPAREAMLLGSYYAGIAMVNAGGGPASGISYPLGVHFNVPHGIAGGIFLPHVVEFNAAKGYSGYASIYDNLPGADISLTDSEKVSAFVSLFKDFYKKIGAPRTLSVFKIGKKDIDLLTRLTMEQRSANLDLNPVPFGLEDVVAILNKVVD